MDLLAFTQDTGREVRLINLNQSLTNFGWLEGGPNEAINAQSIERDKRQGTEEGAPPAHLLITPTQTRVEGSRPGRDIFYLPAITCRALFRSLRPARPHDDDGFWVSTLSVLWYQDTLAPPVDDAVAAALRAMPWDDLAQDADIT
jgi:hypothetical protein